MFFRSFRIGLLCIWVASVIASDPPFEYRFKEPRLELTDVGDYEFRADTLSYRLPNNTRPVHYDISLVTRIDQSNFDFSGIVRIEIVALNDSREITVHARQLTIRSIRLSNSTNSDIPLLPFSYNVVTEFLTIPTNKVDLQAGKRYSLEIEYVGVLRTDNAGFYRSSYINADGTRTWLATTQFESTDARHAFPCYDEPAIKANFTIHIQHGASYHAISNMQETRNLNPDRTVTTSFATTPLTSTYLIAFIVSDFKYKDNGPNSKFPHRVYAKPTEVESAAFAVDEGEKILDAIANYLQVPFSLPKMDQAAIPQFNAGAMENWGLVTYREEYLLWDPSVHLYPRKDFIVTIIAHEFGHQWFGNLVSPKWWNYIWLNEGFATLFEFLGTDLVHPDWNIFQTFVIRRLQVALQFDASTLTRPMTYYVENPDAIANLFDSIAYPKSGSVLRMFLHAFTEKSFKKALKHYLTEKSYSDAEEDDLFAALERAVKEDGTLDRNLKVKDIFVSWSHQKGFPLLTVTRDYKNGSITLSQERYLTVPSNATDPSTWWIPYNIATGSSNSNDTVPTGWLQNTRSAVIEPSAAQSWTNSDWVIFNKQQTGYYRVLYDIPNYSLIIKELTSGPWGSIDPLARSALIDDLSDFVRTGRLPPSLFFDLIKYLKRETEYAPWKSAAIAINYLNKVLADSKQHKSFREFIAPIVKPSYEKVGLAIKNNEPHLMNYNREIAVELACNFGVELCLNQTYEAFVEVLRTGKSASQHNRRAIYTQGIRKANATEIKSLWDRFTKSTNQDERKEIMESFGSISDELVLQQYLNRSLVKYDDIRFTSIERQILVGSIAQGSQYGLSIALRLLNNHIDEAKEQFDSLDKLFVLLVDQICTHSLHHPFSAAVKLAKSKNYIKDETVVHVNNALDNRFKWLSKHQKPIEAYFIALTEKPVSNSNMVVSSLALIIATITASVYINFNLVFKI